MKSGIMHFRFPFTIFFVLLLLLLIDVSDGNSPAPEQPPNKFHIAYQLMSRAQRSVSSGNQDYLNNGISRPSSTLQSAIQIRRSRSLIGLRFNTATVILNLRVKSKNIIPSPNNTILNNIDVGDTKEIKKGEISRMTSMLESNIDSTMDSIQGMLPIGGVEQQAAIDSVCDSARDRVKTLVDELTSATEGVDKEIDKISNSTLSDDVIESAIDSESDSDDEEDETFIWPIPSSQTTHENERCHIYLLGEILSCQYLKDIMFQLDIDYDRSTHTDIGLTARQFSLKLADFIHDVTLKSIFEGGMLPVVNCLLVSTPYTIVGSLKGADHHTTETKKHGILTTTRDWTDREVGALFLVDCTGNFFECKAGGIGAKSQRVNQWMETRGRTIARTLMEQDEIEQKNMMNSTETVQNSTTSSLSLNETSVSNSSASIVTNGTDMNSNSSCGDMQTYYRYNRDLECALHIAECCIREVFPEFGVDSNKITMNNSTQVNDTKISSLDVAIDFDVVFEEQSPMYQLDIPANDEVPLIFTNAELNELTNSYRRVIQANETTEVLNFQTANFTDSEYVLEDSNCTEEVANLVFRRWRGTTTFKSLLRGRQHINDTAISEGNVTHTSNVSQTSRLPMNSFKRYVYKHLHNAILEQHKEIEEEREEFIV